MHRRELLTAFGIGTITPLGGCLSDGGGDGREPEPLEGEWILDVRVDNEDDKPREWRVESRSQDRNSVGAAWATVPAGESWEAQLRGQLLDERRDVYAASGGTSVSEPWRPAECRRLFADVTIASDGLGLETACREE